MTAETILTPDRVTIQSGTAFTPGVELMPQRDPGLNWRMVGDRDQDITDHIDWCRDLRGLRDTTITARRWVLNRLAICADRPLRELEIGHVQFWEQTVVAGLSAQSRKTYITHVRSFFRWMVATGRMTEDPAVMLTRPKIPKPLPHPIAEPDLAKALDSASPKLAAMLTLMAYAGLRAMEVAHLLWSDIEVSGGQTWIAVRDGKGGRDRIVPIGETVIRALRKHGTRSRGAVFLGRDGRQIRANSVVQMVNTHLRRCGIASTGHKLRARYATQAAEVLDTPLVAQLCGWESLETARFYVKPNREYTARLTAILDDLGAAGA